MRLVWELEDLYPRLVAALPAISAGRSNDNAAAYAPAPDPRRAPVRVEVSDLVADIEDTAKTIAGHIAATLDTGEFVPGHPGRHDGVDAATMAAFRTIEWEWSRVTETLPAMAQAIEERLAPLVAKGRRLIGQAPPPPVPVVTPCPSCGLPTIFRMETEAGAIAVCSNPDDSLDGVRRQWTETEWEDARADRRDPVGEPA